MTFLGLLAVALGFVGFSQLPVGASWPDNLYAAIKLFVFEGSFSADRRLPPLLDIARFLAPLVAGYAALRAFVAVFHAQLGVLTIGRAKDHVVVVGLGAKGFRLAKVLRGAGIRVAVVEVDPGHQAIPSCRSRGIPVIVGDGRDPTVLSGASSGRARSVVAAAGDDGTNLDIAVSVRQLVEGSRGRPLVCFVHLDDLELWRALRARGVLAGEAAGVRIEFFNLAETAARILLAEHPPFRPHNGRTQGTRLAIAGTGWIAESIVLRACRLWRDARSSSGQQLELALVGPGARGERRRLLDLHPELARECSLGAVEVDGAAGDTSRWRGTLEGAKEYRAIYVCVDDEKEGLVASLMLSEATQGQVPIVLAVAEEEVGAATAVTSGGFPGLSVFGLLTRTVTPELLTRGTNELLAQAAHEHYVESEVARGVTPADNESLVGWRELPEALKESNRRLADGIGQKLEVVGCALVPAPLADASNPRHCFSEEQVEALAPAEHDRWMRDLERDGWTWGDVKDPVARRHPQLIAWEALSEAEREKDRVALRSIPAILARAGFELVSVAPQAQSAAEVGRGDS